MLFSLIEKKVQFQSHLTGEPSSRRLSSLPQAFGSILKILFLFFSVCSGFFPATLPQRLDYFNLVTSEGNTGSWGLVAKGGEYICMHNFFYLFLFFRYLFSFFISLHQQATVKIL